MKCETHRKDMQVKCDGSLKGEHMYQLFEL